MRRLVNEVRGQWTFGRQYGRLQENLDPADHVRAAVGWLVRAHDAGQDRGVSFGARLDGDFLPSYPETTGYIIPTFLTLAGFMGDSEYRRRAIEMGDWEIEVQLPSGAVMGGMVNSNPLPALFNTGQVLLGWSALYRATGEPRFLEAARRASDWMIEMQEPSGHWPRGNSRLVNPAATLYNVKAAWGLCEAGKAGLGEAPCRAAIRNADFTLEKQITNGWFRDCDLNDPSHPLTHTICYAMQGLIGIGRLLGRPDYIDAAAVTARSLIRLMAPDGFLPGRINDRFKGTVSWSCLTGTAQFSIVCSDLWTLTGDDGFREARMRANRYLMARHDMAHENPVVRGGMYGSWPVWGDYLPCHVLNWATKFFVDALVLELRDDESGVNAG